MNLLNVVLWFVFIVIEHEVDGEAFMELTEDDISKVVKKIGVVKKIIRLRAQFQCQMVCLFSITTKICLFIFRLILTILLLQSVHQYPLHQLSVHR